MDESVSNCDLVEGVNMGIVERSMACPGFALSSTTKDLFGMNLVFGPIPTLARRSCAFLRSASFSACNALARLTVGSSSSELVSSSAAFLLLASRCSSILCDFVFLLAAAAASALALAAAAFAAFSRSASESSSSSQLSATYGLVC